MAVQGVDVSKFDGTIDWSAVSGAGIEFAYVKATEALQNDPSHEARIAYFQSNWRKIKTAGILRSAYHFFRDNDDSELQALVFVQAITNAGGLEDDDLPPMVDVETNDGADRQTRILRLHRCLAKIEDELQIRPIIYTYRSFFDDSLDDSFGDYPLWIASYGPDRRTGPTVPTRPNPSIPAGFSAFTIWQYASHGQVDGIHASCDLNLYAGTLDDLKRFSADSRV